MKKLFGAIAFLLISFFMCSLGFSQDLTPVPEVNIFEEIARIVMNWGSMSDLAKGSVLVLVLTQAVKQVKDFQYKNALVAVFSVLYAIIQMMISGSSLMAAATTALFTMGGAVLIYNAIKPLLAKIPALSFLNIGKSNK